MPQPQQVGVGFGGAYAPAASPLTMTRGVVRMPSAQPVLLTNVNGNSNSSTSRARIMSVEEVR